MIFPVRSNWKLTADYNEPRPLSLPPSQRKKKHGAWDIAAPVGTPIYAPETGLLVFHHIYRSDPNQKADWFWEDGTWYLFSNYYADIFGCLIVLFGESGNTYAFCHIETDSFYKLLFNFHPRYRVVKKAQAYNRWVKGLLNLDCMKPVIEGDLIGYVGNEGYSQGPHIHLELHKARTWGRRDPAEIWPEEYQSKGA